jgi:thiol-disulfide isomerase/thioredoxin
MAQNGRILARLDELEGIATGDAPTPSDRGLRPAGGLAVGTPAPEFSLPDLTGTPVPLKSLLAGHRSVLLLFTDPACGPCRLVLPLVSQWQAAAGDRLHIEVISRGDHAANVAKAGEYGLRRVLLQADREISEAYATGGTPAAVLVGPDGTIAAPMAGGFDQIRDLVASLIGAEADSSLQPPAPPLTGLAPSFQLPNLAGREVSLDALLSLKHPVMLHFSAPQCGPCHALVPDIGGWQRHYHDRLTSVLISSGSPEHNRLMTSEYGVVPDLVLLQAEREIFDAFNMHQMPSALVIDPSGSIHSEPVYGVHAVRQLVADTLGLRLPDQPAVAVTLATVGEQSPVFRRPDLQGTPHDIGVSSAGETVLLFWNPGCPHCQELLPQLREWETHRDAPEILVVSRGPRALNRQLGLASPVVIDDDRSIFRSFGATGTPAAVVIDANGIVASPVGRGVTGVRDLIGGRIASNGNLQ